MDTALAIRALSGRPDVVYHYTSMSTLLKIIEHQKVWATSIRYLNDVRERQHFLELVQKRIPLIEADNPSFKSVDFNEVMKEKADNQPFDDDPFVASFSESRDSLPQWRSYCPNGNGVSIGFRTSSLSEAKVDGLALKGNLSAWLAPFLTFDRVRYIEMDDRDQVDGMMMRAVNNSRFNMREDAEAYSGASEEQVIWSALNRYASLVKHSSFRAEEEWRLVTTIYINSARYVRFRASRSTLIPYVEILIANPLVPSLGRIQNGFTESFIESVTVGPTPHPELSVGSLRGLFRMKQWDVKVQESAVPFRDL